MERSQQHPAGNRRLRFALVAGAVLFVVANIAVIGELWAAASPVPTPRVPAKPGVLRLPPQLVTGDGERGYRFRPNASAFFDAPSGEFSVNYEINELGLREPGMLFVGPNPPHVVFLGDEFTEGWGVMREATFIQDAQRMLRTRRGMDRYTRLLNAGMSGYGAAQSHGLARELLARTDVDMLVFVFSGLMPVADFHFVRSAGAQGPAAAGMSERDSSFGGIVGAMALGRLVRAHVAAWRAQRAFTPGDPMTDPFAAARGDSERSRALYARSFAQVLEIRRLAHERGIPFVLLHVPLPVEVADDEWREGRALHRFDEPLTTAHDEQHVARFCADHGIDCLMAGEVLREVSRRTASPVYFRSDYTLTSVGHSALARYVAGEMYPLLLEVPLRRVSDAGAEREAMRRGAR